MYETKDYIIKIAFGLFLQKNFKEVTMRDIVKETKLSKGAFYHYFESKEQLLLEVLNSVYINAMRMDYQTFSKDSLYQFGHDLIDEMDRKMNFGNENAGTTFSNVNFYFLMFDGMKIFPEFKEKIHKMMEDEFNAWRDIIHIAREKGEIKSAMTDEQIAKLFITISDGIGMHLIIENKLDKMKEEFKEVMDGLYNQLKA